MATLALTITEAITLNGKDQGGTYSKDITGINDMFKRIVTCPANVDTTIFRTGVTEDVTDSSMAVSEVKYIRVTNLDSTNPIILNLQIDVTESGSGASAANETASITVAAGHSFIMGTPHDSIAVYDTDSSAQTTLHDLESILVDPAANAVQVEILAGSS